jgi:hypothetical protein
MIGEIALLPWLQAILKHQKILHMAKVQANAAHLYSGSPCRQNEAKFETTNTIPYHSHPTKYFIKQCNRFYGL